MVGWLVVLGKREGRERCGGRLAAVTVAVAAAAAVAVAMVAPPPPPPQPPTTTRHLLRPKQPRYSSLDAEAALTPTSVMKSAR